MIRTRLPLALAFMLALAWPASANFVREPALEELMARSDLVVIGTVIAAERKPRWESTATLSVSQRLKGESPETIVVQTDNRIDEMNTRCCDKGASYIMFLVRSPIDGRLHSVWGAYGMVRVGGPGHPNVVIKCRDPSRRGKAEEKGRRMDC